LDPLDAHFLVAIEGWLELGNPREAAREWERISPPGRRHPAALERRWQVLARLQAWDDAVEVAAALIEALPHRAAGWLHHAYALRRATRGGLPAAWEALHSAAERFPDEDVVAYNLACYATQLGRPDEGWEWYLRAVQISGATGQIRQMALLDPDLEPLWPRIRGLGTP
jgi:tetratricopeptide (TPR) repeat protein